MIKKTTRPILGYSPKKAFFSLEFRNIDRIGFLSQKTIYIFTLRKNNRDSILIKKRRVW